MLHLITLLFTSSLSQTQGFLPRAAFHSIRKHDSLHLAFGSKESFYDDDADNFGDDPSYGGWIQGGSRRRSREQQESMSFARQQRLEREQDRESRFLSGDELQDLRQQVSELRHELMNAHSPSRKHELEQTILRAQQMDAEFIYQVANERAEAAEYAGLRIEAARYRQEAEHARAALPQFNLEGLWVGKYGDHGFELINITYSGDTLIATKITGDQNVPKGQMSFQVDLSPKVAVDSQVMREYFETGHVSSLSNEDSLQQSPVQPLEPIELNQEAAEQWGSRFLQRFPGMGQVASSGYRNVQWMEGQLIMVGTTYFSFAWLPIGHQVFFGRPSPEMTLKLMRKSLEESSVPMAKDRQYLDKCWEETELLDDDMEASEGLFVSNNQNDYYSMNGCFE